MDSGYIAVLDSGIGGISVLRELENFFPFEHFLYFGDNQNAPYGNRSTRNLLSLTIHNINILKAYPIKMIVLACNTLSVNLITQIQEYSMLPVFGVFPPVESCILSGKKTLLLSTVKTSKKYTNSDLFESVGFYNLASEIESNLFCLEKVNFLNSKTNSNLDLSKCKKGEFENVIIGCTHYNFIKNQIFNHFQPHNLLDGTTNLITQMQKVIKKPKSSVNHCKNEILFIGENAKINKLFYVKSGWRGIICVKKWSKMQKKL